MQNNFNFLRLKKPNLRMSMPLRRQLELPNKRPDAEKIIVVGGTGCVGERIGKYATNQNYNVWSLSKNFPYSFPNLTTRLYVPLEDDQERPWPLFMTWRRFNILRPFASAQFMSDISGAKTMIHCVGQQRPTMMGYSRYIETDKDDEHYQIHRMMDGLSRFLEKPTPQKSFEETNFQSVISSLEMAKHLNVRNFIYISASGVFPTWPFIFGDKFLDSKQKAEEILGGIHFCADGTPLNIAILRPRFIYCERKPFTSGLAFVHSTVFPNSPVASKLTADRVARCAVNLSAKFKDVTPESTFGSPPQVLRWNLPQRWIMEDEDIFNFVAETDDASKAE